eukprot:scaffold14551_cov61-Phaeocystis_antarctica.AAC.4
MMCVPSRCTPCSTFPSRAHSVQAQPSARQHAAARRRPRSSRRMVKIEGGGSVQRTCPESVHALASGLAPFYRAVLVLPLFLFPAQVALGEQSEPRWSDRDL